MGKRGKKRYFISSFVALSLICSLILIINSKLVTAGATDPDFYYYSSGRKYALTLSTEKVAVRFKEGLTIEEQKAVVESEPALGLFSQREESPTFRLVLLPLLDGLTEENVIQTLGRLNSRADVEAAFPIFVFPHSEIILTDEFIVKFGPDVSKAEIDAFNTLNGVEIEDKIEGIEHYILRVKDPTNMNTLRTANLYYESPITIFSVPNFVGRTQELPGTFPSDYYFSQQSQQWPLHNTGQNPPGGTENADINAPEGWDISTGSSDIVIAVLDSGVDYNHEDLAANIWINQGEDHPPLGVVGPEDFDGVDDDTNGYIDDIRGWDCYDGDNDPSPEGNHPWNAHGTACAGLAAAETDNRGIGVAGVAWDCKVMPIRVYYIFDNDWLDYTPAGLAAGIAWAADRGADVLSCSWMELADNDSVHDAIIDAKNNGREGKGCVIVIAAHNYNCPLTFPSAYPEVIAVGATNHHDVRWNICPCSSTVACGSNFGPELDVVAPSGWGPGQGVIMWTTDISGSAGFNQGNTNDGDAAGHYYKWFSGTSAATPEVAGLAGLILSVNPDLTADEVQFIIEDTADDKGDAGWDKYYGWGRINNERALLEAGSFSIDDTLFGWWKFDETTDTTAEDSAGNNDGTLTFMDPETDWVTGKIDGALDFDGDDDYVKLDHAVDALKAGPVTISAWIKADDVSAGAHPIVSTYYYDNPNFYGYSLYVASNKPIFLLAGEVAESGVSIIEDKWYHLAGTYDGHTLKIYVNGGEPETNPQSGLTGYYEPYDDTYIGYEDYIPLPVDGAIYFDGKIDDVRVYRRALSIFEIWDAMSGDLPRFRVKDSSGETVAWFDSFGNLILKGSLIGVYPLLEENPAHDEFRVRNSEGDVALIDATNGDMIIVGGGMQEEADMSSPVGFIIKNSNGDVVAYIDDSDPSPELDHLYLKGKLYENPD